MTQPLNTQSLIATLVAVDDAVHQAEGAMTTNDRAAARRHCARARRLLQQAMALLRGEAQP